MDIRLKSISMEDYLKTISWLSINSSEVRVADICKKLFVKASSVSEALSKLSAAGLVQHPKHGSVTLTVKGILAARELNLRYETLLKFLTDILKVPPEIAEKDACGMEHSLSSISLDCLTKLIQSLERRQN